MKTKRLFILFIVFFSLSLLLSSEELPVPTYANSVIVSIEHNILDSDEVDYIKNLFNFGLYAWPCFSRTTITVNLDWHSSWENAPDGIQSFKDTVDTLIEAARAKDVGLHIVITSGLARGLWACREAKTEDIRNCQWFNDNNLAENDPTSDITDFDRYVFGTFSRYARKLRSHLEAKAKAVVAFLKQRMDENPDVLIVVSGWRETEMADLPVGSTLDKEKGIFYWSIGPGFLNTHILHFAVTDGSRRSEAVRITLRIRPKKKSD